MRIVTQFVYPPIPDRNFDWSAVDDETYDGAPDAHCPIGYGPTEIAAIRDLLDQIEERKNDAEAELVAQAWWTQLDQDQEFINAASAAYEQR